nr:hypothetical protein [Tanacetum cinerariifolium]
MLVIMPFGYLKLCDSDDYSFGVDISSRLPVSSKSIELLTFTPPMRDSPECMFVIANRHLTPRCTSSYVGPSNSSGVIVSTLSRIITNAEKSRGVSISLLNERFFYSSDLRIDLLLSILSMRIFFSSSSDRLAATAWDVLDELDERVKTAFSLWSNSNKEPKLGRSCREELGAFVGEGTGVCCRFGMIGVDGEGRVVVDNRDNNGDDFVHPKFSTYNDEDKEEESFDPIVQTPSHVENTDDEDNDEDSHGMNVEGNKLDDEGVNKEDDGNELYRNMNINLEGRNIQMTDNQQTNFLTTQEIKDTHVIITLVNPEGASKERVKAQVSKILPKIEKTVNEQLEAEVLTRSSNSSKTSHAVAANLSELELKKILIDKMESNKRQDDKDKEEEPFAGSNRGSKRRKAGKEPESTSAPKKKTSKTTGKSTEGYKSHHKSSSESAQAEEPMHSTKDLEKPAHQEFDTAFVMIRLKVDTMTPELLDGPTYELMKESCKSLPLPLIPTSRGRRVIPFDHFINNNLEYLSGGVSSQKYTTSVTKTKAADYGHIKWIKDLAPRTMWSQVESARDVYSKRIIITITELQISEWHNYKHLDWITVHRDDGKLNKFKEVDFNRLRIQDIEDMLLLLVQSKLTNLTVDERLAFNVSLRLITRSIVVENTQTMIQKSW